MHIFLTNESEVNAETTSIIKGLVQVIWAHSLAISVFKTAIWDLRLSRSKVLNNNGFTWTGFVVFNFNAFAEENSDCLLIAERGLLNDALSTPEVIKMILADPLVKRLRMELVLKVHFDALVRLHIAGNLGVANHCMTEKTELLACFLLFIIH